MMPDYAGGGGISEITASAAIDVTSGGTLHEVFTGSRALAIDSVAVRCILAVTAADVVVSLARRVTPGSATGQVVLAKFTVPVMAVGNMLQVHRRPIWDGGANLADFDIPPGQSVALIAATGTAGTIRAIVDYHQYAKGTGAWDSDDETIPSHSITRKFTSFVAP